VEPYQIHGPEGHAPVTGLLFFAVVGIALLLGFLALSFRRAPKGVPDEALSAVSSMLTLEGSSFANPNRLLDDTEYQILLSNPDLRRVARQFRDERQRLAILWISMLLTDLKRLWRFRRFLIRQGVQANLGEEIEVLQAFVVSLIFLSVVRVLLRIWGPFVFARTTRRARSAVERMSYATAGVLGRIPPTGWPEVERSWARSAV
jgi:hypothetical protein